MRRMAWRNRHEDPIDNAVAADDDVTPELPAPDRNTLAMDRTVLANERTYQGACRIMDESTAKLGERSKYPRFFVT